MQAVCTYLFDVGFWCGLGGETLFMCVGTAVVFGAGGSKLFRLCFDVRNCLLFFLY